MNIITSRVARIGALAVACAGLAIAPGCGKSGKNESAGGAKAPSPDETIRSYTVRGVVESLPSDTTDLQVHHEAIPEFVRQDGSLGMDTMTMAFWPPVGVAQDEARVANLDLTGIAVGDKVALTFEVVQNASDGSMKGYYATKVEKLPADTALDFSHLAEKSPAKPEDSSKTD